MCCARWSGWAITSKSRTSSPPSPAPPCLPPTGKPRHDLAHPHNQLRVHRLDAPPPPHNPGEAMTEYLGVWCPTCEQDSLPMRNGTCGFCDTPLVRRRGGWKRPDAVARSRISRNQARAIHSAHIQGRSLRDIARSTWQTLGYSSDKSCLEGIRTALQRERLAIRPQGEATSRANSERSMRLPGESKNDFKRRRRREYGYRDTRTGTWRIADRARAEDRESQREGKASSVS